MTVQQSKFSGAHFDPARQVLQAALHQWTRTHALDAALPASRVLVTVSRQPGAGAISFSHHLAQRLNAPYGGDWSAWDHELVERVSADHHVPKELIEMIPDRHRSWLTSLVDAISNNPHAPDFAEVRAYKRVVTAIRALAEQGHAIIVGQGGTFVTEGMPGAIHLRLVAPLEYRIQHVSDREHLPLHEAAARVTELDAHRAEFFRNFWHRKELRPEQFTLTLNAAELPLEAMVEAALPVIRLREASLVKRESADHQPLSAGPVERTRCDESSYCV